jgi:hypothetical protein
MVDALTSIEGRLYQLGGRGRPVLINDKLAHLADVVDGTDGRPTGQVLEVYDLLVRQLAEVLATLQKALEDLARINDYLATAKQPPIVPRTDEIQ